MKLLLHRVLLVVLSPVLLFGCAERGMFKDIQVRPNLSLPLGSVNASDSSLFSLGGLDGYMKVSEEGVLTFFDSTTLSLSGAGVGTSLIEVPEQTFSLNKVLPPDLLPFRGGTVTLPAGEVYEEFALTLPEGAELDTVIFTDGSFSVNIDGLEHVPGYDKSQLRIIIPSLRRNGQPVVLTAGLPLELNEEYMLLLATGNRIRVEFEGEVPTTISSLTGSVDVRGGNLEYVAGFFGRREINRVHRIIDANTIGDFTGQARYVRFDRPEIAFTLHNEYNAPLLVDVVSLMVDGRPLNLKPGREGRLIYVAPQGVTRVVLGNEQTVSGSELSEVLTKDFRQLAVEVQALLNPTESDLGGGISVPRHNSMHRTDTLGGNFVVELPLEGVLDGVGVEQELEVDLAELDREDMDLEELSLALSGRNSLPLSFHIEVLVQESGSGAATPLFDDPIYFPASENNKPMSDPDFKPGVVNADNLILRKLSTQQIERLQAAESLKLRLTLTSLGAEQKRSMKIYSPAELKLQVMMGARAALTMGTPE